MHWLVLAPGQKAVLAEERTGSIRNGAQPDHVYVLGVPSATLRRAVAFAFMDARPTYVYTRQQTALDGMSRWTCTYCEERAAAVLSDANTINVVLRSYGSQQQARTGDGRAGPAQAANDMVRCASKGVVRSARAEQCKPLYVM